MQLRRHRMCRRRPSAFAGQARLLCLLPAITRFDVDTGDCYPCHDRETYAVTFDGKIVAKHDTGEPQESRSRDHPDFVLHFADTQPHASSLSTRTSRRSLARVFRFAGSRRWSRCAPRLSPLQSKRMP